MNACGALARAASSRITSLCCSPGAVMAWLLQCLPVSCQWSSCLQVVLVLHPHCCGAYMYWVRSSVVSCRPVLDAASASNASPDAQMSQGYMSVVVLPLARSNGEYWW